MITQIDTRHELDTIWFEDIDSVVTSQPTAFVIQQFYFYYFSTKEAAIQAASQMGISTDITIRSEV